MKKRKMKGRKEKKKHDGRLKPGAVFDKIWAKDSAKLTSKTNEIKSASNKLEWLYYPCISGINETQATKLRSRTETDIFSRKEYEEY